MYDKEYLASLDAHRDDQKVVARERNQYIDKMEKVHARIKESLSPDASEEDLKAALEKDPEWQELLKNKERLDKDIRDALSEARETVRKRMLREQAEANTAGK